MKSARWALPFEALEKSYALMNSPEEAKLAS
jgi:hypothetical protein